MLFVQVVRVIHPQRQLRVPQRQLLYHNVQIMHNVLRHAQHFVPRMFMDAAMDVNWGNVEMNYVNVSMLQAIALNHHLIRWAIHVQQLRLPLHQRPQLHTVVADPCSTNGNTSVGCFFFFISSI